MIPSSQTVTSLISTIRQRSDTTNSNFVTDPELEGYINLSNGELGDILVQKAGDSYRISEYLFTTNGTDQNYPLPVDFMKAVQVALQVYGSAPGSSLQFVPLKQYMWSETGAYAFPFIYSTYMPTNIRYRLSGNAIRLEPLPQGGQVIRLLYAPRPTQLASLPTIMCNGVQVGDTLSIAADWNVESVNVQLPVTQVFTCVVGAPAAPGEFQIGSSDSVTATNLAAALTMSINSIPFTASATLALVTITLPSYAVAVKWSGSNSLVLGAPPMFCNYIDGISGWQEYVITDVVIKVLQKLDQDASLAVAQKMQLQARILSAATNRNQASPQVVSQTIPSDIWGYPGMGGWGGVGGGWGS